MHNRDVMPDEEIKKQHYINESALNEDLMPLVQDGMV
jgi:hypothetical protein